MNAKSVLTFTFLVLYGNYAVIGENIVELVKHNCEITPKSLVKCFKSTLQSLSKQYPKTGRAFRIVPMLDDFYNAETIEDAEKIFDGLYSWMRRSRLPAMKNTALTLNKHKDLILNYFSCRLTNAIYEGINSLIQSAKRTARGFHTFKGFASKIYLVAGKLNLSVAYPF